MTACTILAVAATSHAVQPEIIYYVRASGSDTRNGRSAEGAFRTIQKALSSCKLNGKRYTIYVGPGVYPESVLVSSDLGIKPGQPNSPNVIIGDVTGTYTGDSPGEVVIDGGHSRSYAVSIDELDYWSVSFLTLRNQTTYGVRLHESKGTSVTDCDISPAVYGIYSEASDVVFDRNTFARTLGSGTCIYAISHGQGDITVRRNRMTLVGIDFLSSGYSSGHYNIPGASEGMFGVYAATEWGPRCDIYIQNNVVSDALVGIYVSSGGNGGSDVFISNNTLVGCCYPAYVLDNNAGAVLLRNTIASQCYYPATASGGAPRVEGLLSYATHSGTLESSGWHSLSGVLTGDPRFLSPSTGDFSLDTGSPALDVGVADPDITTDINGVVRPADGDHDGLASIDLGAFESSPSRLRIIRVAESRPALARILTTTVTRLSAPKESQQSGPAPHADDDPDGVKSLLRKALGGNR